MLPKRLLALTLFAALAAMHASALRAQWVQTNGLLGASNALLVSGSDLFAGTWAGVFRSSDSGKSWTSAESGLENREVFALTIIGAKLFAGTDSGVFVSIDSGAKWNAVYGLSQVRMASWCVFGADVFAGTLGNGVFRSTDSGVTWLPVNNGIADFDIYSFAISDSNILLGTSHGGVFRSTNDGNNWNRIGSGLPDTNVNFLTVSGTNIFAATSSGLFHSSDSGMSWNFESFVGNLHSDVSAIIGFGTYLFAGVKDTLSMFRSSDNGDSWTEISLMDYGILSLAVNGENLFMGTYGGLFVSQDSGSTYFPRGKPLTDPNISALATIDSSLILAGTQGGNVFLSMDKGINWVQRSGIGDQIQAFTKNGNTLFVGDNNGNIFRSTDTGNNWMESDSGLAIHWIGNFSFDVIGTKVFAGTTAGVYVSTNDGITWTSENNGLPTDTSSISATGFAMIGAHLFLGTDYNGVFRSDDSGRSWVSVNDGLNDTNVVAITSIGSNLVIGAYNWEDGYADGIFLSTDMGVSWQAVDTVLGSSSLSCFAMTAVGSNLFAAVPSSGALISTDSGHSWTPVNTGLPIDANLTSITSDSSTIFVGNYYSQLGVYRRAISEMIPARELIVRPTPSEPEIQVYPNPFSQSTTIIFSSQAAGYADVSIVNLLGVEVAHLFSGELAAGEHSFAWSNPPGLPDGIYECLVRMNGQVETLPVVLAR